MRLFASAVWTSVAPAGMAAASVAGVVPRGSIFFSPFSILLPNIWSFVMLILYVPPCAIGTSNTWRSLPTMRFSTGTVLPSGAVMTASQGWPG